MSNTKEKILTTALHLFAGNGFEAVSVSDIAGELGITKGALYRHYQSKRDIFDHIIQRMYEIDAARSRRFAVPEEEYGTAPAAYRGVSVQSVREFTLAQFAFWTSDPFASDFRKMLSLERYRNAEMAELYRKCITAGPMAYMEDIFREMAASGVLCDTAPALLALEFYAPFYLLIELSGSNDETKRAAELLESEIDRFFLCNSPGKKGEEKWNIRKVKSTTPLPSIKK